MQPISQPTMEQFQLFMQDNPQATQNPQQMQQNFQLFQQWCQFQKMQQDLQNYQKNLMEQQEMLSTGKGVGMEKMINQNMSNMSEFYSKMGTGQKNKELIQEQPLPSFPPQQKTFYQPKQKETFVDLNASLPTHSQFLKIPKEAHIEQQQQILQQEQWSKHTSPHLTPIKEQLRFSPQQEQNIEKQRPSYQISDSMEQNSFLINEDLCKRDNSKQQQFSEYMGFQNEMNMIDEKVQQQKDQPRVQEERKEVYKNPLDDMPIKTVGSKTFEELIEEQLREQQGYEQEGRGVKPKVVKKTFLKKNSRKSLASSLDKKKRKKIPAQRKKQPPPLKQNFIEPEYTQPQRRQINTKIEDPFQPKQQVEQVIKQKSGKPKRSFLRRGQGKLAQGIQAGKKKKQQKPRQSYYNPKQISPAKQQEPYKDLNLYDGSPVRGKLVSKYFGCQKKPPIQERKVVNKENYSVNVLTEEDKQEIVQKYVSEQLENINRQISKFRRENKQINRQTKQFQSKIKQKSKEIDKYTASKQQMVQTLLKEQDQDLKQIRKQQKAFERQQKQLQKIPNKKVLAEIDTLHQQLKALNKKLKKQRNNNKLSLDGLHRKITSAQKDNSVLKNKLGRQEKDSIGGGFEQKEEATNLMQNQDLQALYGFSMGHELQNSEQNEEQNNEISINSEKSEEQEPSKNEEDIEEEEEETIIDEQYQMIKTHQEEEFAPILEIEEEEEFEDDQQSQEGSEQDSNKEQITYEDLIAQSQQQSRRMEKIAQGQLAINQESVTDKFQKGEDQRGLMSLPKIKKIHFQIDEIGSHDKFNYERNEFYVKAQGEEGSNKIMAQNVSEDGKIQRIFANGKKEVIFPNGVQRQIYPNGYTIVHFNNKDVKQVNHFPKPNQKQFLDPARQDCYLLF